MITVFIVEDHELARRGLRDLLDAEPDLTVVGEADCVAEALQKLADLHPDVTVLDARLPDGSGVEICRRLNGPGRTLTCLVLTSFDDDAILFDAIDAGVAGFFLKRASGEELLSAVRHLAAGGSLLDSAVTGRVMTRLRDEDRSAVTRLKVLTPQEREILHQVARGHNNRQIAEEMGLAEKTVKNYVSRVLAKLGFAHRTQAAVFALKLEPDHDRDAALHPEAGASSG